MRVKDPKQIKKLLIVKEASARTLAAAVGYRSHAYVTRILRGEIKTVTQTKAEAIAEFLGVGVDDLFVARVSTESGQSTQGRKAS